MSLRISGKHMNVGETLSQRIQDRIDDAVSKYFAGGFTGHVNLEKGASGFKCDSMVHLDTGVVLQASAEDNDATAAFESSADKVEKRLRRYKRRLKDHHHNKADKTEANVAYAIVETPAEEEEIPEDYNPVVIAESQTSVSTQSVAQAVMQLDMTEQPVIVFTNAGNGNTNVVYRRSDGNIGWMDLAS